MTDVFLDGENCLEQRLANYKPQVKSSPSLPAFVWAAAKNALHIFKGLEKIKRGTTTHENYMKSKSQCLYIYIYI